MEQSRSSNKENSNPSSTDILSLARRLREEHKECQFCGILLPARQLVNHQKTRACANRRNRLFQTVVQTNRVQYYMCSCRSLVSARPSEKQAHQEGQLHRENLARNELVLQTTVIECWCGVPYLKNQALAHIYSEQHVENYGKMRRLGYIPFREYTLTGALENRGPRCTSMVFSRNNDRYRWFENLESYICEVVCNIVANDPIRFDGPTIKDLIFQEQKNRELLCLMHESAKEVLTKTAFDESPTFQNEHFIDPNLEESIPMFSMSQPAIMTFLNNLPSTQLAARHNTLRDLRTIDDIVPRDLLDVEIRDRRPPPEPVRSVLQVVELPSQVDRSPLQNVSPQQKPEHTRYNSTGLNCNSNSMSFSISRSSRSNEANTVPVFQRQVSDFEEETKNESLTLSQKNRYAQLQAIIGNEGMALMGSNGCVINENGDVLGPQNNLLDDESIVNIVRSAFSYKEREREMDSESHQSSQNMERERWLRHRDSNGNPIYHNVSDLPDI